MSYFESKNLMGEKIFFELEILKKVETEMWKELTAMRTVYKKTKTLILCPFEVKKIIVLLSKVNIENS